MLQSFHYSFGPSCFMASQQSDLTPEAYAKHLKHISAPSPLSAREAEIASIRAAEGSAYVAKTPTSHIHVAANRVETQWSAEVVEAFQALRAGDPSLNMVVAVRIMRCHKHVVLTTGIPKGIDLATEGLELRNKAITTIDEVKNILPKSDPCRFVNGLHSMLLRSF